MACEYVSCRVGAGFMRQDEGGLDQRTGVPTYQLLPDLRAFPPVVVANHDVNDQIAVRLAPEPECVQEAITSLRHAVQEIPQHNEPGAIVRNHELRQPLQIGNCGTARHRDSGTTENIVLAEMRVRDNQRRTRGPN
jgi:hypothetical protein